METEIRVDGLVDRWEVMRNHGAPPTIEELCAGCPELVDEVQRRIQALQAMDSALETDATQLEPTAGDRMRGGEGPSRGLPGVLRATAVYRTRCHHDHGGLGVVFTAHQEELDRTVALKRIRPDKLHEVARRRFLREAALTAQLQHPGIVPIYGLGEADGGPFYTMPFIKGQTLQDAIGAFHGDESLHRDPGRRSLHFRGLLQHFMAACNTVAYSHDQEVVHRDLKPSNIMLGPYGETLVMDWGLAKRFGDEGANQDGGEAPSPSPSAQDVTATGEVLGTPQYMSPEQAKGEPAGPAGDIFSLGLVLYAILTGKSAFAEASLRGRDWLNAVREAVIVPPRNRDPHLPRALEAICLKALAARPEDRYASARALADDVMRWLGDEPVTAWREPVSIRARRWARRHRTAVAVVVVAMAAGVVGLAAVAGVQARANVRLKEALAQVEEARQQADAVSMFLVDAFRSPDPTQDGRQVKVAEVLDQAAARLDREFERSPAIQGALLDALGRTYSGLGLYGRAVNLHTKAGAVREAALGPEHPVTLGSRNNLAEAYRAAGRLSEAIALHQATLERRQAKLGPDHPDTLQSCNNLAIAYYSAGWTAEAIALHEATLKLYELKLGPDHPETLQSRTNLAAAYLAAGRTSEAIALGEATLKLYQSKLGPDHRDTLATGNNLAAAYLAAGRTTEAIVRFDGTLRLREAKLGPDHPDTLQSRNNLAIAYLAAGRPAEAIVLHEPTLKLQEANLGPDHPDTLMSRINLADAYLAAGRTAEAIALYEETSRLCEAALGPDHPFTLTSRNNLAEAHRVAGRLSEAIALFELTLELRQARLGPDHPDTLESRTGLASASASLGRWGVAEALYRDTMARRRQTVPPDSPLLAGDLAVLGRYLLNRGTLWEAERLLHEALAIRAKATPDDWRRYDAMSLLGGALLGQGRHAEAEPLVVAGHEGMKARAARIAVPDLARLREAAERVVHLYEDWGRPDQATAWKAKLGMPDLPADVFARP